MDFLHLSCSFLHFRFGCLQVFLHPITGIDMTALSLAQRLFLIMSRFAFGLARKLRLFFAFLP
jgi:hypothetical protein